MLERYWKGGLRQQPHDTTAVPSEEVSPQDWTIRALCPLIGVGATHASLTTTGLVQTKSVISVDDDEQRRLLVEHVASRSGFLHFRICSST